MTAWRALVQRLLLGGALTSVVTPLWAEDPAVAADASASARAIALGQEGLAELERGQWQEALRRFSSADALAHSPVFVLYEARCERRLRRLLAARSSLQRVLNEPVQASAPPPWQKARADAQRELDELSAQIPSVVLLLSGPHEVSEDVKVLLDGRVVPIGTRIELDPGSHVATVVDGSLRIADTSFEATLEHQESVVLRLPREKAELLTAPPPPHEPSARPPATASSSHVPAWILVGAGAAAVVAGGFTGVMALNKVSSLRDHLPNDCRGTVCLNHAKPGIDAHFEPARNLALASDILWISGAALMTVGITWIIIDSKTRTDVALVPSRIIVTQHF